MSFRIAVAGKGGVGKTTISALLVRALNERTGKVIMAVDADPNSNLGEKLGVRPELTVGDLREEMLRNADNLPVGQSKQEYVEYQMRLATVEGEGFDLLSMGRPEGPGCYCYINNILRTFLDEAMDDYDFVVIDNEAGMEHLSRRTTKSMDILMAVSDPTKTGMETVARLVSLAKEMGIDIGCLALVMNGVKGQPVPAVEQMAEGMLPCRTFAVPFSEDLMNLNAEGRSLLELGENDHAYKAVKTMLDDLVL
ncbi:MAG: AAA family ATPase [Methanomassiliicoccales archaeon]|nr:AAA family ATPase [Methanomassiliicoccales archaeon]